MAAIKRLQKELKSLSEYSEFSCYPDGDNFLEWNVILYGPIDTPYEYGLFKAKMKFTMSYPNKAPEFQFTSKITHPNIYKDGKVCISILHEGVDQFGYESIYERWNPQQGISSILLSILSIFGEPNFESPANVDASVLWKSDFNKMKSIIYKEVAESQK